jgi:hypothetical protein
MKRRALVVTLQVDDNIPDNLLAQDVLDDLIDAGYTVETVNPFGGDSEEATTQPQIFGSFFKPSN